MMCIIIHEENPMLKSYLHEQICALYSEGGGGHYKAPSGSRAKVKQLIIKTHKLFIFFARRNIDELMLF